jgi:hypothetical protein
MEEEEEVGAAVVVESEGLAVEAEGAFEEEGRPFGAGLWDWALWEDLGFELALGLEGSWEGVDAEGFGGICEAAAGVLALTAEEVAVAEAALDRCE